MTNGKFLLYTVSYLILLGCFFELKDINKSTHDTSVTLEKIRSGMR